MDDTNTDVGALLQEIQGCFLKLNAFADHMTRMSLDFSEAVPTFNKELEALGMTIETLEHDMKQGTDRGNYKPAFRNATQHVHEILTREPYETVEIRILALAASFSWDWLVEDIIPLFGHFTTARCNFTMLLVDPDHKPFQEAGFTSKGKRWSELSRDRPTEATNLFASMDARLRARFSFSLRFYQNLPHWHGVLIQDAFLLLGRANWVGAAPSLHMRAGENAYREFDRTSQRGVDRLTVYNSWFDYYASVSRPAFSTADERQNAK